MHVGDHRIALIYAVSWVPQRRQIASTYGVLHILIRESARFRVILAATNEIEEAEKGSDYQAPGEAQINAVGWELVKYNEMMNGSCN